MLRDIRLFEGYWKGDNLAAWVVLPDHFHAMVRVDDTSLSDIMHNFKITYSRRYRDAYGAGKVWQNRFWDHVIRDQKDFNKHVDYIHYNPVKHGLITDPFNYEFPTLREYYKSGYYERDWGAINSIEFDGEFGE